eukprot:137139-Pelagomonas_calceolata.AAC.3
MAEVLLPIFSTTASGCHPLVLLLPAFLPASGLCSCPAAHRRFIREKLDIARLSTNHFGNQFRLDDLYLIHTKADENSSRQRLAPHEELCSGAYACGKSNRSLEMEFLVAETMVSVEKSCVFSCPSKGLQQPILHSLAGLLQWHPEMIPL